MFRPHQTKRLRFPTESKVEVEEGLYNCIDDGHPELGTSTYHAMYIILNLRMLDAEKGGGGEGTRV